MPAVHVLKCALAPVALGLALLACGETRPPAPSRGHACSNFVSPKPCCPPPKAIGCRPRTPTGSRGAAPSAAATTSSCTGLSVCDVAAARPAARSAMTSAASLPASTAPSIEPRNFWLVQSPASTKLGTGVAWLGR